MCRKVKKLPVSEVPDLNAQIEFLYSIRRTLTNKNTHPWPIINTDILDAIIQTMISHKINLYTERLEAQRKENSLTVKSVITDPNSKTIL